MRIVLVGLFVWSWTTAGWAASSLNYQLVADGIVSGGEQTSAPANRLYRASLGEIVGTTTASANAKLSTGVLAIQSHLNLLLPHQAPTLNPLITPTAITTQTLTGTKASDTSLWLNGAQIIPFTAATTWSDTASLVHGTNVLQIFTKDLNGNASATITAAIVLDLTPPATPVVTDDGAFTTNFTQLHATWTSNDPESGIQSYEYRIGITPTGEEIVPPVSAGAVTGITRTGLTLVQGQRYYISVRAKNGVGLWSDWGLSDGLYANSTAPTLNTFSPAGGSKRYIGDVLSLSASASDPDGDLLEYQFRANGAIKQPWSSLTTYNWLPTTSDRGLTTIEAEARDGHGGLAQRDQQIYILRKPLSPP